MPSLGRASGPFKLAINRQAVVPPWHCPAAPIRCVTI